MLIAEDDDDARLLLGQALSHHGAIVFPVSNGEEGVRILLRERPHVVVSDLTMPVMGGYELLKTARQFLADVPCIAVTGSSLQHQREEAVQAGFDAHIPKPVDFRVLIDVIADLVSGTPSARTSRRG